MKLLILRRSDKYSVCHLRLLSILCRSITRSFINVTETEPKKKTKIGFFHLLGSLGAGVGMACAMSWQLHHKDKANYKAAILNKEPPTVKAGQVLEGLPEFTLEEVAKHNYTAKSGVWVMYGDGVYDITEFLKLHPGGSDNLMRAAGKSLNPFWESRSLWFHNREEVYSMLEELRIGNVAYNDRAKMIKQADCNSVSDQEPDRSPLLITDPIFKNPFCAETPMKLLANKFLTPNHLFYVRNHFPVPLVDPQDFYLEVSGEGIEAIKLTLDELKSKFTEYTIVATIQCAGNRRSDLSKVKPLSFDCQCGYIGNAEWTGVWLRDVLLYAGIKEEEEYTPLHHVHFEGLDHDPLTKESYGASIHIHKAMDKRGDCLLAYKMNGEDIPRDHGYPLRAIVPGHLGARNVKWLRRIVASKEEHSGIWQQKFYKGFPPSVDWSEWSWSTMDFSTAPAIQEMPVQSAIYSPEEGTTLDANEITMSGIAWSGGGRGIIRVDVSCDGGKTWQTADLLEGSNQTSGRAWAWTLWTATVEVQSKGQVELCCKAVDTSYNVQPDTSAPLWNVRGYLSTAWHRIVVNVN